MAAGAAGDSRACIVPKDQWIFSNKQNQPFAVIRPYNWLVKFQKMAHIRPIILQGLHHTHATLLMANNPNIIPKDIEARLGHTDIETTLNIYTHVTDGSDDKVVSALNNFKHKEKAICSILIIQKMRVNTLLFFGYL